MLIPSLVIFIRELRVMATQALTLAKLRYEVEEWLSTIVNEHLANRIRKCYVLAGGAIVSTVLGQEVNDYDIWLTDGTVMQEILGYYFYRDKIGVTAKFTVAVPPNAYGIDITHPVVFNDVQTTREGYWIDRVDQENIQSYSHFSMTLQNKIQLIYGRTANSASELVKTFDFEHNKVWLTATESNLNPYEIDIIRQPELMYTGSIYPLSSMLRIPKFLERGKTISAATMKRILDEILAMPKEEQLAQTKFVRVSSDGQIIS